MTSEPMRATLRITKALADIQRVRILMMLRPGERCVCQIIALLGLAPSTVSKHLALLNAAGLVEMRREGRWAHYRLPQGAAAKSVRPVLRWLDHMLARDPAVAQDVRKLKGILACDPASLCRKQRQREAGERQRAER